MFARFLFCVPLIVSLPVALAQTPVPRPSTAPPASPAPVAPVTPAPPNQQNGGPIVLPSKVPCDCCAGKPHYGDNPAWAPFVGTVAVMTQQRPQANTDRKSTRLKS